MLELNFDMAQTIAFAVILLSEFIAVELSDKFSLMLKTSFSFHPVYIPVYPLLGNQVLCI